MKPWLWRLHPLYWYIWKFKCKKHTGLTKSDSFSSKGLKSCLQPLRKSQSRLSGWILIFIKARWQHTVLLRIQTQLVNSRFSVVQFCSSDNLRSSPAKKHIDSPPVTGAGKGTGKQTYRGGMQPCHHIGQIIPWHNLLDATFQKKIWAKTQEAELWTLGEPGLLPRTHLSLPIPPCLFSAC